MRDPAPAGLHARQIPDDLVRQVLGPDDQVLGEGEISPGHDEHQSKVAQVLEYARRALVGPALGPRRANDGERKSAQRLTDPRQQAEGRRIPLREERHDPVHGGEGDGDPVDQQAERGDRAQAPRFGGIAAGCAGKRPLAQQVRKSEPHDKVNGAAHDEKTGSRYQALPCSSGLAATSSGRAHAYRSANPNHSGIDRTSTTGSMRSALPAPVGSARPSRRRSGCGPSGSPCCPAVCRAGTTRRTNTRETPRAGRNTASTASSTARDDAHDPCGALRALAEDVRGRDHLCAFEPRALRPGTSASRACWLNCSARM